MLRYVPHILLTLLILSSIGLSGYMAWEHHELKTAHVQLEANHEALEWKSRELQKNFAEQKSMTDWLQKAKRELEQDKVGLQERLESVQKENKELRADTQAVVNKLKGKLQEKVDEFNAKLSSLSDRYSRAAEDLRQARQDLSRKDEKVAELNKANSELTAQLSEARGTMERYLEHNSELVAIAQELVQAYKDKGVADVLAQKEPLTQVKKVELEQFVQEYSERIEAQNLTEQGS